MTHIDVHGGKARPESTRSIQKDSGEMRGGPERKSRQGSLSPAVRGGRSSEVPVPGWRHSYGVGSPSGQRPHLCPERRRVSGWPGPAPPRAAPPGTPATFPPTFPRSAPSPRHFLDAIVPRSVATLSVARFWVFIWLPPTFCWGTHNQGHCPSSQTSQTDAGMASRKLCQYPGSPL